MSQNDFNIANQGFPSFRSDLNDALQALASNSSGATEPATTYAGQFWYDSTNNVVKFRNEANSAWIDPPIAGLATSLSDFGVTASAAELNKMDGVTATTAEINYIDGVTSNIQTQLNAKGVGDITGVTAGTNLTGGGTSGGVTVNLTASPNITSLSVGSSEVISSSRQLKNIASVDATTVAALGAAGVGGATSVITDRTYFSGVSALTLSLDSEYDVICIDLYDVKHNQVSDRYFNMRLGDGSSTTITGSEYLYSRVSDGSTTKEKSTQIQMGTELAPAASGGFLQGQIFLYNANKSSVITTVDSNIMLMKSDLPDHATSNFAVMRFAETNANVSFYCTVSEGGSTSGTILGYYKLWGIKL